MCDAQGIGKNWHQVGSGIGEHLQRILLYIKSKKLVEF